jgi:hypothetical protein
VPPSYRLLLLLLLLRLCASADEFAEGDDAVLPPSPYEMEEDGWTGSDDPDYQPFDGETRAP